MRRYEIKDGQRLGSDFSHVFGISVETFVDKEMSIFVFGYWIIDLSKFEKFIKPGEKESIENATERKYGKSARKIIECLL